MRKKLTILTLLNVNIIDDDVRRNTFDIKSFENFNVLKLIIIVIYDLFDAKKNNELKYIINFVSNLIHLCTFFNSNWKLNFKVFTIEIFKT